MASITIQHGHKNLLFASEVANQTGATFEEQGQWITIEDSPTLTIPRYCFDHIFDPEYKRRDDSQLESAWRSLLLNKRGHLRYFGDDEIYITDDPPAEKRPSFLLRFPDEETKTRAEEWAERAGFPTLTEFILNAISTFCDGWEARSKAE